MSENIQSIANGSFVLGSTSATTYQAGPGISITQPSEGTVRISNDETVLYSGAATNNGSLNESVENFDTIKVNYITDDGMQGVTEFMPSYTKSISLDSMYVAQNSAVWFKATNYTFSSNTSFNSYPHQLYNSNKTITANWYNKIDNNAFSITKVIGINRISGGNA